MFYTREIEPKITHGRVCKKRHFLYPRILGDLNFLDIMEPIIFNIL